jgi:3-hydroxyacyl-CoA dehydrogenase/3a,7a,12a-trihydroxy-5b-cholest-24-enoyl-CoA hydratase/multifunctional beta-oxidation protein/peroxisomal enoyl-CoA hydratase 2
MSIIIRGMGGFGFKGKGATKALLPIPTRNPDKVLKSSSYLNQALIYRLTGDINPLHVDPNIASLQNYEKPILHGRTFNLIQVWRAMETFVE